MRLFLLFLFFMCLKGTEAAYHINPKSAILVVAGSSSPNADQFKISLDFIISESGDEVLTIVTQRPKKKISPIEAYNNFKRVGGMDENADISLTPILMKVKFDGKSIPVRGRVSFSRSDAPTESWIYLNPTDKKVEVSFE